MQRVTSRRARRPTAPRRGPHQRTYRRACRRSGSGTSAVEVRRSTRRRRTVSAYREGDRTVVLIPARMSEAEEQRWVTRDAGQARRPGEQAAARRRGAGRARGAAVGAVLRRPGPARTRSAGSPTRTPAGARAPRPRAASGSRTGCRACPSTSSTTCSCTNWRTCWCPATDRASGSCWRPIRAPSGPAATSKAWSPPSGCRICLPRAKRVSRARWACAGRRVCVPGLYRLRSRVGICR